MSVVPEISLSIVRAELSQCKDEADKYGWLISEIHEQAQVFTVKMQSPVDGETYVLEVKFDNYKEWPLYLEFIDPTTGQRGVKNAYPQNDGNHSGFFHGQPCICNPCSRKAYHGYGGVHNDWKDLVGWQRHEKIGELKDIGAILRAIYFRISTKDNYRGRMK